MFRPESLKILAAVMLAAGCSNAADTPGGFPQNTDLSGEWPRASAVEQGFDPARLDAAFRVAASRPAIKSLLVFRNGYLVRDEYFAQDTDTSLVPVYGMTTSFLSALVGIAIGDGHIGSVDQPVADFLPADVVDALDPLHRSITLRHLLTMTSGLEWAEGDEAEGFNNSPFATLWRYALSKPVVHPPGTRINYNSGAASLLGAALSAAVGRDLLDYGRDKLFGPLGIDSLAWAFDGDYRYGGSSMRMTASDAAKLGMLYVNGGMSGGRQIVARSWIEQSMAPVIAHGVPYRFGPVPAMSLGFLWWIPGLMEYPAFFAWGSGGQFVYAVPALKLVAVTTTNGAPLHRDDRDEVEKDMLELIVDRVVPAIVR